MKKVLMVFGLLLMLVPGSTVAETLELLATEQAVISSPDSKNEVRLLIRFSLPSDGERRRIDTAYFDWPMTLAMTENELPWIQAVVYEAGKQWNSKAVTWNSPWTARGGDLLGQEKGACLLIPGQANIARFEVTSSVQAWENGTRENFGFIVMVRGEQIPMLPVKSNIEGAPSVGPVLHIFYADKIRSTPVGLPD